MTSDDTVVEVVRWGLLVGAGANVLLSTVLFHRMGKPITNAVLGRLFSAPSAVPRWLRSETVLRVWGIAASVVALLFWWYLGATL